MKLDPEDEYKILEILTTKGIDEASAEMLAMEYDVDEDKFQDYAYKAAQKLVKDFLFAGKSQGKKPKGVDPKEFEMGIKVEMEHTDSKIIATKITWDHLTEDPKYYTHLSEMEKKYNIKEDGISFASMGGDQS